MAVYDKDGNTVSKEQFLAELKETSFTQAAQEAIFDRIDKEDDPMFPFIGKDEIQKCYVEFIIEEIFGLDRNVNVAFAEYFRQNGMCVEEADEHVGVAFWSDDHETKTRVPCGIFDCMHTFILEQAEDLIGYKFLEAVRQDETIHTYLFAQ